MPRPKEEAPFDEAWTGLQGEKALAGLKGAGFHAFMEVRFALRNSRLQKSSNELRTAAEAAVIHAFGWPIAVVLNREDARPRPRADGIYAEIVGTTRRSYDYWALRRDGAFYFLHSLFEDAIRPDHDTIFFDSRIVRITETLLYCARLYNRLGEPASSFVDIKITHSGLLNRTLGTADPRRDLSMERKASEDHVATHVTVTLGEIESQLSRLVAEFTRPLFEVFDFFQLSDEILRQIVDRFVDDVRRQG